MMIEGIGRALLKLHNVVVKILFDVRFKPNPNVNIIFLGELESHGYKYVADEEICNVLKCDSLVLNGRKRGEMYYTIHIFS